VRAIEAARRVEFIMGTAIVIDARGAAVTDAALDAAFDHFRDVDARYSTFRHDSEISRLARGELAEPDCSAEVRAVLADCEKARMISDGYFDIWRHRSDRVLDPSGFVKGWSVEGAMAILDAAGIEGYCINAGGDVFARGDEAPGTPWRIGIRNPWDAPTVAAVVSAHDLAIATSGTYERGQHVIDPHCGRPPDGVVSMTVIGPSVAWADAWATAAFAMGVRGVDWVARELDGYEAMAITTDRHVISSSGFERFTAAN
jgi:thiamine biosynthesis lipoprotein